MKTFHSSTDSLLALISSNVGYANKVVYNWGDDSETVIDVQGENTVLTESHKYAAEGLYKVTVTAYNDFGNYSSITLLSVGNDDTLNPAPVHDITIKNVRDPTQLIGTISVEEGKRIDISKIAIDEDFQASMVGKKIVALYVEYNTETVDGSEDVTYTPNPEKKWLESNVVYSSSPDTLYADLEDKNKVDTIIDETKGFFESNGQYVFIIALVMVILGALFMFFAGDLIGGHMHFIAIAMIIIGVVLIILNHALGFDEIAYIQGLFKF
jgi:PKD repeat protein